MKILITGICGFAGASLVQAFRERAGGDRLEILGLDNFSRPGSETNRRRLPKLGVNLFYGDLRQASDLDVLPAADWVIDAAANPSVLSGAGNETGTRQIFEHNLISTLNLLEYCKKHRAGFILMSTSRVYSVPALNSLPLAERDGAFALDETRELPPGVSPEGITEDFSTAPPLSFYGTSKLASETLALEYGEAFEFPVWINRCGVLAGAGQFGRPDQGIFSFWIHSCSRGKPLRYTGYGGQGHQVRDCLHPRDLIEVLRKQFGFSGKPSARIFNFGGGPENAMSLCQLSRWCAKRFGPREIASEPENRPFDAPWTVMDCRRAKEFWDWRPRTPLESILDEIAGHAEAHPEWLELSSP